MIGGTITRDVALRVLEELEQETVDRITAAARAGALPVGTETWERWRLNRDKRLLVLEVLRELVKRQPHEVLRQEGEEMSMGQMQWAKDPEQVRALAHEPCRAGIVRGREHCSNYGEPFCAPCFARWLLAKFAPRPRPKLELVRFDSSDGATWTTRVPPEGADS